MVFWTDKPTGEPGVIGGCGMASVHNIVQADLFSACHFTRQVHSAAFREQWMARFPDGHEQLRILQDAPRMGGTQGEEYVFVLRLMGYTVKTVDWFATYMSDTKGQYTPAAHVKRPMPTLVYLLNRANAQGSIAIQLSIGEPRFRDSRGWQREADGRLDWRSVLPLPHGVIKNHSIVLRKVNGVWYILDNNVAPWEWGDFEYDVLPGGWLEKGWAELRGPKDQAKFDTFTEHLGKSVLLFARYVNKSTLERPYHRVVRSFVQKRRHAKEAPRGRQYKACGGRGVPVRSYTYIPTPRNHCGPNRIALRYGPGCKTYRKCVSKATERKTGV